jgi:hypothetical protein
VRLDTRRDDAHRNVHSARAAAHGRADDNGCVAKIDDVDETRRRRIVRFEENRARYAVDRARSIRSAEKSVRACPCGGDRVGGERHGVGLDDARSPETYDALVRLRAKREPRIALRDEDDGIRRQPTIVGIAEIDEVARERCETAETERRFRTRHRGEDVVVRNRGLIVRTHRPNDRRVDDAMGAREHRAVRVDVRAE